LLSFDLSLVCNLLYGLCDVGGGSGSGGGDGGDGGDGGWPKVLGSQVASQGLARSWEEMIGVYISQENTRNPRLAESSQAQNPLSDCLTKKGTKRMRMLLLATTVRKSNLTKPRTE
jgi:hypothetical protein